MKRIVLYLVLWVPATLLVALPVAAFFFTNIPQDIYMGSVRNIFFDCLDFVPDDYVYKMRSGPCRYRNIEYDVSSISDTNGFRKSTTAGKPDVAVIGDSHAYGFGVGDDQTFAHLLEAAQGYRTINLAIGSYATARELEVLTRYGGDARYIVLQYCDNDRGENAAFLDLPRAEFRAKVEAGWKEFIAAYRAGKARGLVKPIEQLGVILGNLSFERKTTWRKQMEEQRDLVTEAALFARILVAYKPVLMGRRLIVLESTGWGVNARAFAPAFGAELAKIGWLQYRVLDTSALLSASDYYFLDDHLRPEGHRKLAAAIAREIAEWKREDER